MNRNLVTITILAALAAGGLAIPVVADAQTGGMERRGDRRDNREDARDAKRECKAGDEKSRPECRQDKRDNKQENRGKDEEPKPVEEAAKP